MIVKMLELSTAHYSKETNEWLEAALRDEHYSPMAIYPKQGYGCWLNVPEEWEDDDSKKLPYDLLSIIMYAKGLGAEWIMFDRDAGTIDILPKYEW